MPRCNGCSVHYDYDDFWMKSGFFANFGYRCRILEVKKRKIIRILLGIHFWGLNCTIVDLKCLKFDNNKEEEEKEDNNDREEEEDNNNKEDNDIKEEEEAPRAKRRPEGPKEARRASY